MGSQTPNPDQQPEVDEDGYCIQPKSPLWEKSKEGQFTIVRLIDLHFNR